MLSANERISLRQLQVLIILSAMGTGLIVLPRRVAEFAGQDGWVITLGLTVVAVAVTGLVCAAARVRGGLGFLGWAGYGLSRPVAYLCGAFLWLKLVFAAGLELRSFLLITQQILLELTPMWLVGAVMLVVCWYAAAKGIETRAHVAEVLVLVLALPLVFLLVVAVLDIDWSNLQPVLRTPPERLGMGVVRLGFIFTGLECLLLAGPYIAPGKKMARAAMTAVGTAGFIITAITVLTLAKFGPCVVDEPWPVLRMMDMLNLPGGFIERQEALMFSFWIITTFALVSAMVFFSGRLLGDLARQPLRSKKHPLFAAISALAIFGITFFPWESADIEQRLDWMYYTAGAFFLVIFPLAVLAGAKLRKHLRKYTPHAAALLLLVTLTACHDRVEIENRTFVVAMAIDKAADTDDDARYTIAVLVSSTEEKDDDDDEETDRIKKASGQTLTEAFHKLDETVNTRLYYGQAKLLLIGEALLTDATLTQNLLRTLTDNPEIDRQLYLYATAQPDDNDFALLDTLLKKSAGQVIFSIDLGTLNAQLTNNAAALIPQYPDGAIVLKNFAKTTTLDADQLRGFQWSESEMNEKVVVTTLHVDTPVPFTPHTHRARTTFTAHGDTLRATIHLTLTGEIAEAPDLARPFAELLVANAIAQEITDATAHLQQHNADAFHWRELLRKKQPDLYNQFAANWEEVFPKIEVVPRVVVTLEE